jgi:ABC-type transport system involved in multi-copper enzyme maturation permease subunit
MRVVWVLALNTYKEVIRDRILYGLILFAFLLIGLSLALGQLSFAEQARISANFGLSAIHLVAVALAIFVGSNLVYKEIDKKTILTILVRPISRLQFILGKAFGLGMIITTMIVGLSLVLVGVFMFLEMPVNVRLAWVLVGLFCEALILLGFTLVFAMFTRPIMVVCLSIGVFLIGHWQDSLEFFAKKSGGGLSAVHFVTSHFLPNLEKVNWKDLVLYDQPIDPAIRIQAVGYALAWFGLCVCLSSLMFRKKDVG